MTQTRDINQGMRAQFTQKATLPKKDVAAANMFLDHLHDAGKPTPKDVARGQKILHKLEAKTELYEFYAAVRAGQEASDESDLENRVNAIVKSVETVEKTKENLRRALEKIA